MKMKKESLESKDLGNGTNNEINSANGKIGVIFDLDGTLLNDVQLAEEIPETLKHRYNLETPDEKTQDEMRKRIMEMIAGKSSKTLVIKAVLYVAKKYGVPWYKRLDYLKRAAEIYKSKISKMPFYEGVEELIKELKEDPNIEIGIYTTGSSKEVKDRFTGREYFLNYFNGNIITRDKVKHMKPSPEGILKLKSKWNIKDGKRILMIGDMPVDINAGKNANCITVGVTFGFASREMMENQIKPDFIIDSILELREIIKRVKSNIE
ncbi:MAG: HAD family hydrolase [Promethearchaeota archaeon]